MISHRNAHIGVYHWCWMGRKQFTCPMVDLPFILFITCAWNSRLVVTVTFRGPFIVEVSCVSYGPPINGWCSSCCVFAGQLQCIKCDACRFLSERDQTRQQTCAFSKNTAVDRESRVEANWKPRQFRQAWVQRQWNTRPFCLASTLKRFHSKSRTLAPLGWYRFTILATE